MGFSLSTEIVSIKSNENNMIPRVFIWDWNEPVPYREMLKHQHRCPTLHLYEYDPGTTLSYFIFAPNRKIALREVIKSYDGVKEDHTANLRRIF